MGGHRWLGAAVLLAAVAGCGGNGHSAASPTPAAAPAETPVAARAPEAPAERCGWILAALGDTARALDELDAVMALPQAFDANWLSSQAESAEATLLLGAAGHAAVLYERLLPYAGRPATAGRAVCSFGSLDRHLGGLAALLGRDEDAERHLRAAVARDEEMGCAVWAERGRAALRGLTPRSPGRPARVVTFSTRDGVRLDGAIAGRGPMGVVFVHEYPADLCGWWQFGAYAARRGMHVMLFDMRCLGLSGCGRKGRAGAVDDVRAAMRRLRQDGARRIAIVGASWGGTIAVVAGAALRPDAVVELSGEVRGFVPGYGDAKVLQAAGQLRAPALFASARGDRYVSAGETRAAYEAAGSAVKRLRLLGPEAGHGWGMMFGTARPWSPLAYETLAFLRQQLHGS